MLETIKHRHFVPLFVLAQTFRPASTRHTSQQPRVEVAARAGGAPSWSWVCHHQPDRFDTALNTQHRDRTLNVSANQSAPSTAALPYVSLYGWLLRIKLERLEVRFSAKASLLPDGAALAAAACFQH